MKPKIRGDRYLPKQLWYFSLYHSVEISSSIIHEATKESPQILWDGTCWSIYNFRLWDYHIKVKIGEYITTLLDKTELGYYTGSITTRSMIRYWNPSRSKTMFPDGKLCHGLLLSQDSHKPKNIEECTTVPSICTYAYSVWV